MAGFQIPSAVAWFQIVKLSEIWYFSPDFGSHLKSKMFWCSSDVSVFLHATHKWNASGNNFALVKKLTQFVVGLDVIQNMCLMLCTANTNICIQWGSEIRPFEIQKHFKSGFLKVGFQMVQFLNVQALAMAIAIVPTIWKLDHSKFRNFCPDFK